MHQRPEPDFALVYAERVKCLVPDVGEDGGTLNPRGENLSGRSTTL
jgi:hypothetical protein